jgi:hypothetical protein
MNYKFKILFFFLCFILVERLCHRETEGFRPHKILSDLSFHPEWEIKPLSEGDFQEVKTILHQPFHFLKSGGQCYTFLSEDQRFVLKVFKHHHMRVNSFLNKFSLPGSLDRYRLKLLGAPQTPEKRLFDFFLSCHLSYQELKTQTALIYLHLNKTDCFQQPLTLVDKLGISHSIDLDSLEFVLQRKAELVYPKLRRLVRMGAIDDAKRHLDSLLLLIQQRIQKGISDKDPVLRRNFGFIGERAIGIDVGSYEKVKNVELVESYKRRLLGEVYQLQRWLKRHDAELASYFDQAIADPNSIFYPQDVLQ